MLFNDLELYKPHWHYFKLQSYKKVFSFQFPVFSFFIALCSLYLDICDTLAIFKQKTA